MNTTVLPMLRMQKFHLSVYNLQILLPCVSIPRTTLVHESTDINMANIYCRYIGTKVLTSGLGYVGMLDIVENCGQMQVTEPQSWLLFNFIENPNPDAAYLYLKP